MRPNETSDQLYEFSSEENRMVTLDSGSSECRVRIKAVQEGSTG